MLRNFLFVILFFLPATASADVSLTKPSVLEEPARIETLPLEKQYKPQISIIVDDLGDNAGIAEQIASLPVNLTLAILPHTPFSEKISYLASKQGHEVILHLPMESFEGNSMLGPGALLADMHKSLMLNTFGESAQSVPNLVGFNNHMGSKLTQDRQKMDWVMDFAKENHWYFLDSKTSSLSVAKSAADDRGLPNIVRDIFLDHHQERAELGKILQQRLEEAKKLARLRGHVVVICHPYPETYEFLSSQLSQLAEEFELVKLSKLLVVPKINMAKSAGSNKGKSSLEQSW